MRDRLQTHRQRGECQSACLWLMTADSSWNNSWWGLACVFNRKLGKGTWEKWDCATNVVWVLGRQTGISFFRLSLGNSPATLAQLDSTAVSRFPVVISLRKGGLVRRKRKKDGRSGKTILANNSNKNHYVRRQLSSFHSLSLNTVEMRYLVAAAVLNRCREFVLWRI